MDIIIGSGNKRQKYVLATGDHMKAMAKASPIEHTKIMGNMKALVRQQPLIRVKGKVAAALKAAR